MSRKLVAAHTFFPAAAAGCGLDILKKWAKRQRSCVKQAVHKLQKGRLICMFVL